MVDNPVLKGWGNRIPQKAKVEVSFKELISRKSLKTVRSKPEAMALSR
jgi:hypothetical protein